MTDSSGITIVAGARVFVLGSAGGLRFGRPVSKADAEKLLRVTSDPREGDGTIVERTVALVAMDEGAVVGSLLLLLGHEGGLASPEPPFAFRVSLAGRVDRRAGDGFAALLGALAPIRCDSEVPARLAWSSDVAAGAEPPPPQQVAGFEWRDPPPEEREIYQVLGERMPILWPCSKFEAWVEESGAC